jgi:transposase
LGEDITETLEVIPRQWKVIQHVCEKFTCRDCEKISQAPAPFHVLARGWAGPSLLAMILFEKFGQHQPLNRQAERYAREGVPPAYRRLPIRSAAAAQFWRRCSGASSATSSPLSDCTAMTLPYRS